MRSSLMRVHFNGTIAKVKAFLLPTWKSMGHEPAVLWTQCQTKLKRLHSLSRALCHLSQCPASSSPSAPSLALRHFAHPCLLLSLICPSSFFAEHPYLFLHSSFFCALSSCTHSLGYSFLCHPKWWEQEMSDILQSHSTRQLFKANTHILKSSPPFWPCLLSPLPLHLFFSLFFPQNLIFLFWQSQYQGCFLLLRGYHYVFFSHLAIPARTRCTHAHTGGIAVIKERDICGHSGSQHLQSATNWVRWKKKKNEKVVQH